MQLLIDKGADFNCNDGWLGTALVSVLEKGKPDIANWIIEHPNFNPNITGGYYGSASRFLCFADKSPGTRFLKDIILRGGSPSERVIVYGSLLEVASHFGKKEAVELLLREGADLDGTSMGQFGNAVHAAAMNGDEEILQQLLEQGEDPNCSERWLGKGHELNKFDLGDGYEEFVLLIQGTGFLAFDHSWVTKAFFAPAIHAAMRLHEHDHNKVFLLFKNESAHRNGHLGNPLQGAAFRGHTGVMRFLPAYHARIDAQGGFFGTALQAAASQNHLDAVNSSGKGALAAAITLGFEDIIQALVDRGASCDCPDYNGWSARTWECLCSVESPPGLDIRNQCETPSAWSTENKLSRLCVDGLLVKYAGRFRTSGPGSDSEDDEPSSQHYAANIQNMSSEAMTSGATVLANHPLSPYSSFYFEVTVEDQGEDKIIAIGMSKSFIPTFKIPGLSHDSWVFRGDDGCFELKSKHILS